MTQQLKQLGKPGDTVVCALAGCDATFALKERGSHQLYCTKAHRNVASKKAKKARDDATPKVAKKLRKGSVALGGTDATGGLFCGTAVLDKREVFDPRNPPQHDARFW